MNQRKKEPRKKAQETHTDAGTHTFAHTEN